MRYYLMIILVAYAVLSGVVILIVTRTNHNKSAIDKDSIVVKLYKPSSSRYIRHIRIDSVDYLLYGETIIKK